MSGTLCKATLLALLCVRVEASETRFLLDGRYLLQSARTDEQIETVGFEWWGKYSQFRVATRVNESGLSFNAADYSVNAALTPLSWTVLTTRLVHRNRFPLVSSTTTFLGSFRLEGQAPKWLGYFFEFGAYFRSNQVQANTLLPVVQPSYTEWDVVVAFGVKVSPWERWWLQGTVATLEYLDVYNLNNPYVELAASFPWDRSTARAYLRYQMLLGFGLRDTWVAGLLWELPLAFEKPSGNGV